MRFSHNTWRHPEQMGLGVEVSSSRYPRAGARGFVGVRICLFVWGVSAYLTWN